jgi:release factor glutamine methyltransferase
MTVLELLENTTAFFTKRGISSPRLTIELLLADTLGKSRMQLYLEHDQPVPEAALDKLRPLVKRRAEGEPLEYVLGHTTFAGQKICVCPDVLIPRPDTEILLDEIVKLIDPAAGLPVLDVGTGSGILALALARKFPTLEIVAVDISAVALAQARRNFEGATNIRAVESDLLAEPSLPPRFQLIVANLPYIPSGQMPGLMREVQHEPKLALDGGPDGLDVVRRLVAQSAGRTRYLALEIGDGQGIAAKTLCESAGYAILNLLPDMSNRDRVLLAEHHG